MTNLPVATTDAKSERRLARSLGYPKSWHVVRSLIPHPSSTCSHNTTNNNNIVQDRIFAGDPAENADLYYNHGAAFEAATSWVEDESTPYDDEGGQMLAKEAKYKKGTDIQVLYDDGKWYNAKITKVAVYPDDIRYTVLYTKENTYQNNVTEDEMRPRPKRAATPSAKKTRKAASGGGKKRKVGNKSAAAARFEADAAELELATEMGLPDGWTARALKNSNFVIYSPGRTHRFTTKKAAFAFAEVEMPPMKKKARRKPGRPKKKKVVEEEEMEEEEEEDPVEDMAEIEEGDPPWRLEGHDYIQKRVRIEREGGSEQFGTIVGWIADTDVDKEGEPGFVSDLTGKPACLFHVKFDDSPDQVESQDFEDYELCDNFVEEEKPEVAGAEEEAAAAVESTAAFVEEKKPEAAGAEEEAAAAMESAAAFVEEKKPEAAGAEEEDAAAMESAAAPESEAAAENAETKE